jgi:hypothetical protein
MMTSLSHLFAHRRNRQQCATHAPPSVDRVDTGTEVETVVNSEEFEGESTEKGQPYNDPNCHRR